MQNGMQIFTAGKEKYKQGTDRDHCNTHQVSPQLAYQTSHITVAMSEYHHSCFR